MNKFFIKRHCVFFLAVIFFVFSSIVLVNRSFKLWQKKSVLIYEIDGLLRAVRVKESNVPAKYEDAIQGLSGSTKAALGFFNKNFSGLTSIISNYSSQPEPKNSIALFFELSDFVSTTKTKLDELGIAFGDNENFGFADYFNKKPQPTTSEISFIYQQKEHINLLLNELSGSRKMYLRILDVKRNSPYYVSKQVATDIFAPDVKMLSTEDFNFFVYEIEFEAFSDTFREFMVGLRSGEIPVVIRGIHCEPSPKALLNKQNRNWVLHAPPTKFRITLEFFNYANPCFLSLKNDDKINDKLVL